MDAQAYIDQLERYATQFIDWWCKPYGAFRKNYEKQNRSFVSRLIPIQIETRESMEKFSNAVDQFEKETRGRHDLIDEIFCFFDENYEAYLQATDKQRSRIRETICKDYYPNPGTGPIVVHYMGNFFIDLLHKYVKERAAEKIKSTGDKIWLMRGLVAISMENMGCDWRDTMGMLKDLYKSAESKGMNPEPFFAKIAEISSREVPSGGDRAMNEMMAKTEWFKSQEAYDDR